MKGGHKAPRSLAGTILSASPGLQDPNFLRTLVFLAEHSAKGALGLVLNRPVGRKLGEVLAGSGLPDLLAGMPLYYGGPVATDRLVMALFVEGKKKGSITCCLGLPLEQLEAHADAGPGWVRAFAGYSGWGEGQLERELKERAWKMCRPDPTLFADHLVPGLWPFFAGPDQRWRKLLPVLPKDSSMN